MSKLAVRWPLPPPGRPSFLWSLTSRIVMSYVGTFAKFYTDLLCRSSFHNTERLIKLIDNRPNGVPLLSACNHHSCMDDPLLWGMLPSRILLRKSKMRWTMAAHDICFTNEIYSNFFALGQSIPVIRGEGVYQRGMEYSLDLLNQGKWVHVYPEGQVNTNPKEFIRLKWGIGRLIAESNVCPIVVPFWHLGMDEVLPNVLPYRLKVGKVVTVNIGEPIDFSSIRNDLENKGWSSTEKRKYITDVVQEHFARLRAETEQLHAKNK